MLNFLGKWLNIYEDEIKLFFWTALLFFLIRSSNILFNNFAETAFLKRFGVEYLPVIYMINSLTTFFLMGMITGIMGRLTASRLLTYTLLICGVSVAALRLVIPFGFEMLYPFLFILKSQYEVLLALLFWNLANDLFNTRQSKRLFPLITAGGVIGGVIGSFGTPFLAKTISIDNLMFAYLGTTLVGALCVQKMSRLFPTLLPSHAKGKKVKSRSSMKDEIKKVIPLIKESLLVKILILLTLLPNVVIPIMNYQFNFAIDQTFATEQKMIEFFGYFRGVLNIISFIILLFVGRIYGRWGLPVALMFHPINYILAFLAFLFRFDIFSAMYARMSTNILRTTINNPARAVLMGLFPLEYRSVIRPFLRGTVVRIGILMGSGFIMISESFLHPRYLSIIAILFVSGWVISTFVLKRKYSGILLDLISRNMLDLKSLEDEDMGQLFQDKKMQTQLMGAFLSSKGSSCLWYAKLIKSLGIQGLDSNILTVIKEQDDKTKIGLLPLLSPEAGESAVTLLKALIDPQKPELTTAAVKAANRLPVEITGEFLKEIFDSWEAPEIRAHAVTALFRRDPKKYKTVIDGWLHSEELPKKRAGIISAGNSQNRDYVPLLREMLDKDEDEDVNASIIEALHSLEDEEINNLAIPYLKSPSKHLRMTALEAVEVSDDNSMRAVIPLLGDESEEIQDLASGKLQGSDYQNPEILIESLIIPNRTLRENIFSLLESLQIKDVDVVKFTRSQLERAYRNLAEAEALRSRPEGLERDMLIEHLMEKSNMRLESILRVLATQDQSGQMKMIWRGLSSKDIRQKSNAIEALEDSLGRDLSRLMVPLLENLSPEQSLATGRKEFEILDFQSQSDGLYPHLLNKYDWVTVVLTLYFLKVQEKGTIGREIFDPLVNSESQYIREMSRIVLDGYDSDSSSKESNMAASISIPDKIIHLRGIQIFEELSVSELAAIASVTEEEICQQGTDVIKEGDQGETMYMIVDGHVSVLKGKAQGQEIELDRMKGGDYFGEMALFEDQVRSATIRAIEETRLLVLHKREFNEIVREYPQIALIICRELSHRMRKLQDKVQFYEQRNECDI